MASNTVPPHPDFSFSTRIFVSCPIFSLFHFLPSSNHCSHPSALRPILLISCIFFSYSLLYLFIPFLLSRQTSDERGRHHTWPRRCYVVIFISSYICMMALFFHSSSIFSPHCYSLCLLRLTFNCSALYVVDGILTRFFLVRLALSLSLC